MSTQHIRKKSSVFGLQSSVPCLQSAVCSLQSSRRRRASGFTLLELLIVISIILVLAGLLLPAFFKVKNAAKDKQAEIERKVIETAIYSYKTQEKKMPARVADLQQGTDEIYGGTNQVPVLDNNLVMNELLKSVPPVLDINKLRWDDDGNVLDPDGNQYEIKLDLNNDNIGTEVK